MVFPGVEELRAASSKQPIGVLSGIEADDDFAASMQEPETRHTLSPSPDRPS